MPIPEDIELLKEYITHPLSRKFLPTEEKKPTIEAIRRKYKDYIIDPLITMPTPLEEEKTPIIPTEKPETTDTIMDILMGKEAPDVFKELFRKREPVTIEPIPKVRKEYWGILPSPKKMRRMEQIRRMKRALVGGILDAPGFRLKPGVYELEDLLGRVEALKPSPIEEWMRQKAYTTYLDLLKEGVLMERKGELERRLEEQRYLKEKMKQEETYKRAEMIMKSKISMDEKRRLYDLERQKAIQEGRMDLAEFWAEKKAELEAKKIEAKEKEKPEEPLEKIKRQEAELRWTITEKILRGEDLTPGEQKYYNEMMKKGDLSEEAKELLKSIVGKK